MSAVAMVALVVLAAGCQKSSTSTGTAASVPSSVPSVDASSAPAKPVDNGVAALTADKILQRAEAALKEAKSYRVKGNIIDAGQKISVDFEASGKDVRGSMTVGAGKVELLSVGGQHYMRPNEQFLVAAGGLKQAQAKAFVALIGDRWAKVPASDKDFNSLFDVANPDVLLKPDGKVSKGKAKVVAGVPTIAVIESGSDGGTLYVATTGKPYPVEMTAKNGSITTFSSVGATFTDIKAPSASEVVDLAALQGK
jgi:hypothetical protein